MFITLLSSLINLSTDMGDRPKDTWGREMGLVVAFGRRLKSGRPPPWPEDGDSGEDRAGCWVGEYVWLLLGEPEPSRSRAALLPFSLRFSCAVDEVSGV